MKNWGLQKLNLTAALFAIPNLIFTVSSNIENQNWLKLSSEITYAFDTNSGLKFKKKKKKKWNLNSYWVKRQGGWFRIIKSTTLRTVLNVSTLTPTL